MPLLHCISSLGCADLTLAETIALAREHGIPAVELRGLGGTPDLAAYLAAQFDTPARLARYLDKTPVRIVALNTSLRLVGSTGAERDQFMALVPWADALGVRRLRVFDGGQAATPAELADAAATVQWWRAQQQSHGWRAEMMVETHDSLLTAAAIARFSATLPDVPLLWDAHHTWRKGGEEPTLTWPAIAQRVVHVHVKDSIGVPSARHPFTYVLPGDGEFPIKPLLTALETAGFSGPVSLEWERLWHPYLPPLAEALRVAAARRWW
jgi:sugar phosphate isomerase/epimerase